MKRLILSMGILSAALSIASTEAAAGNSVGTLTIQANLLPSCGVTTSPVDFGSGTPFASLGFGNGDIAVICEQNVPYNITIDAGQNPNGTAARRLSNGAGGLISYILYKAAVYGPEWGDSDYANTYPSGTSLADVGNGVSQSHTVYGLVYTGGPAGAYIDTVNVTVYY